MVEANDDMWFSPQTTNESQVGMANDPLNDNTPEHGNKHDNWVYINGKVAFGNDHSDTARTLGTSLGLPPHTVTYISNLIARNTVPSDNQVAVGGMRGGYPQIWLSTVDRNAVWDAVMRVVQDGQPTPTHNSPRARLNS